MGSSSTGGLLSKAVVGSCLHRQQPQILLAPWPSARAHSHGVLRSPPPRNWGMPRILGMSLSCPVSSSLPPQGGGPPPGARGGGVCGIPRRQDRRGPPPRPDALYAVRPPPLQPIPLPPASRHTPHTHLTAVGRGEGEGVWVVAAGRKKRRPPTQSFKRWKWGTRLPLPMRVSHTIGGLLARTQIMGCKIRLPAQSFGRRRMD